MKNALQRISIL